MRGMADDALPRLLEALDELADMLAASGEIRWAGWVAESAHRLRAGDGSGLDHVLRAYGGMGSLNDVVLRTSPEVDGVGEAAARLNARFRALKSEVFTTASELSRVAQP